MSVRIYIAAYFTSDRYVFIYYTCIILYIFYRAAYVYTYAHIRILTKHYSYIVIKSCNTINT